MIHNLNQLTAPGAETDSVENTDKIVPQTPWVAGFGDEGDCETENSTVPFIALRTRLEPDYCLQAMLRLACKQ